MRASLSFRQLHKIYLPFLLLAFYSSVFAQDVQSLQKVKEYASLNAVQLGIKPADAATLSVTKDYIDKSTGVQHIYATQKLNGLTITGADFSLHTQGDKNVAANGLVALSSYKIKPVTVSITSSEAILRLMKDINYTQDTKFVVKQTAYDEDQVTIYKRNASSVWDIPIRLVYYNIQRLKTLQPAWEVQMMDVYKSHYWLAYIDVTSGKILEKTDLMKHCNFGGAETDENAFIKPKLTLNQSSEKHNYLTRTPSIVLNGRREAQAIIQNQYRVYDLPLESPIDSIQQPAPHALSTRSGDVLSSPDGWHRVAGGVVPYQYTRGNNVWAFQDPSPGPLGGVPSADPTRTAFNNGGTLGTPVATEPFKFDYPINLANQPPTYQNAAIVNLFYWNNLMHDVFYYMGFDEASANFEESHIFSSSVTPRGKPTGQNDAVLAQAQDGGGTNNANFLTLPDGTNGQMQMYLWTTSGTDSLVQITSSTSGIPPAGKKFLAIQGSFNTTIANNDLFNTPVLNKQYIIVKKNAVSTVGSESEGCSTGQQSVALPPSNSVTDKIVLIDRGSCSFAEKVLGAQLGGAAGVIVINNIDGPPIAMGGADAPGNAINIPAVMISKADGKILKDQLQKGTAIIGSLKATKPPLPKRDGDLDNGVISHEYGHGISSRLTGGGSAVGPLGGGEQGGEGWSDFVALYMTLRNNDLGVATADHPFGVLPTRSIGNYVTYQAYNGRGIREYPYSISLTDNPATFAYIKRPDYVDAHSVGFVWCSMLYEVMQTFIDQYGMNDNVYDGATPTASKNPPATAKGNNIATRLVIEAMKLQPTSPTFIQERDAILKADTLLYNAQFSCRIWKAFAKRGLGYSAVSGTNALGDETESFDVPLSCDPTQKRVRVTKSGLIKASNGSQITYTIKVRNMLPFASSGISVTDTLPAGLSFVSASNTPTVSAGVVKWTINLNGFDSITLSLVTQVNAAAISTQVFGDDHEGVASNWTAANSGGISTWSKQTNTSQAFSGSKYWFAPDTDLGGANTTLKTTAPIAITANAELVFIHKFATESEYDGGVIEVSTDNTTWTYLPPTKFVKGGYAGTIPTANNPSIGVADLAAFTGASDGYIVSVAKLDDYTGMNVYIRFRFTSDAAGGSVDGGGWWLDDVYVLTNRTEITNKATAITTVGTPSNEREGTNAQNSSTSFVLGGVSLPSALGNLVAASNKQSVDLNWKAYNQNNVRVFEIERKANGETNYIKIGEVNPSNAASTSNYSFTDLNVSGNNTYQYRIKQVSKTGEVVYTNIALIRWGGKMFVANIYPNPAREIANISIVNPDGGRVTINLFDGLGKKMATFNGTEAASQLIQLPVQLLASGTYWIEVNTTADNHATLQMVIKK